MEIEIISGIEHSVVGSSLADIKNDSEQIDCKLLNNENCFF